MPPPEVRSARSYVFTLNNYVSTDLTRLRALAADVTYIVWGSETGESGTVHLQGFVYFKNKRSFKATKEAIGTRCHLEKTKGTPGEAADYCKKEGLFEEFGTLPVQGRRNDLTGICEQLKAGKRLAEVADLFPEQWIKFHRGIESWANITGQAKKRDFKTEVRVLVGPPGVGKSRRVYDDAARESYRVYEKPMDSAWWDGYDHEEIVVFNDFYGNYPYHALLTLLDRYPLQVPIKGTYRQFNSKRIYITSNKSVREWYSEDKFPNIDALYRRITSYEIFSGDGSCQDYSIIAGIRLDY